MNTQQACRDVNVRRAERSFQPLLRRLAGRVLRWLQLARERRQLASLSDEALKDIGLNRGAVYQESERPFWDDPLGK